MRGGLRQDSGHAIFLPSEAQWERVARGTDARKFPWGGEAISPKFANFSKTGLGATSAVGIFIAGVSPVGAHDCAGNVWEWCATPWVENYRDYAVTLAKLEQALPPGHPRVIRGGSWGNVAQGCRAAVRSRFEPGSRYVGLGFRPAAVVPASQLVERR